MTYTIGLDFGTNSVRAIVVRTDSGAEVGDAVFAYPSGEQGILLDVGNHNLARQHPADYIKGLEHAIREALSKAGETDSEFRAEQVAGIGIDATGSSPIPVDSNNQPLAMHPEFSDNLNAMCWLWKDHASIEEAERITRLASETRPKYLRKIGGVYSSEWFWSKIWHCLNVDREVFNAAHSWVELCDFIPSVLSGAANPSEIRRSACAAGHKAMYHKDWDGLPEETFLEQLDPELARLRGRLFQKVHDAGTPAGRLCREWSDRLGLKEGIAVAMGAIDVHYGAVGCGVKEGTLVKVIGTSTCDCAVAQFEKAIPDIPGICGIVEGSILPGLFGIEAGQAAVGDLFKWWVERICGGDENLHGRLTQEAELLKPGGHGLLALDWNNGNRNVLGDLRLTGLIVGQTLHTSPAEIYRALIEATAFGARAILERLQQYSVPVSNIVCSGGIASKNPMLMQIYADVTGCSLQVSRSEQSCALGAAIAAAVVAGVHSDFAVAQSKMTGAQSGQYIPNQENREVYDRLYKLYLQLHDAFGGVQNEAGLGGVMKELLEIKEL